MAEERDVQKYLKKGMFPTIFCNGCGHGTVLGYTFWALEEISLREKKLKKKDKD